ncbi:DUF6134 family protein [Acidisoma sp.]|uniref:DUF6134 family protein n=1 Tax=Acidisoma sp. TaxID=1872115 RepID=UPI003B0002A5
MTGRLPSMRPQGRRVILGGAAKMAAGGAALLLTRGQAFAQTVPPGGRLAFNIIRHGSVIGQETLTFQQEGSRLTVFVDVSIRVTLAMIPVYRLHHHETESWEDGQLLSFAATTIKNGSHYYAQGWRNGSQFMARGSARPDTYVAPRNALPTSQWNHAMLNGPMINTQDGKLMHPVVTDLGPAGVKLADGSAIRANRYHVSGDLHFDTFFDDSLNWVGLSFPAPDGSVVTYQKL